MGSRSFPAQRRPGSVSRRVRDGYRRAGHHAERRPKTTSHDCPRRVDPAFGPGARRCLFERGHEHRGGDPDRPEGGERHADSAGDRSPRLDHQGFGPHRRARSRSSRRARYAHATAGPATCLRPHVRAPAARGRSAPVARPGWSAKMNRRLWHLIKPYSSLLVAAIVLLLLLSLLELAGPYLTQQAIDRYIAPKRLDGYQWLAILWFLVLPANGLARYAQLQITNTIGQRVMFDLRNAIFAHWQPMGVAFFDRTAVGELVSLISNDVDAINQVFTGGLILGIGNVVSAVFIIVFLLLINWSLALLVLGMAIVMLAAATLITRQLRQAQRWTRSSLGSINGFIQEAVSGIPTIQLFNADRRIADDFDAVNQQYSRANLQSATLFSIFLPVMNWLGAATVGLLLWFGGGRVIHHLLTLGTLVLFIQFAERLVIPVRDLADKLAIFQTAVASAERIFTLLDRPPADADV